MKSLLQLEYDLTAGANCPQGGDWLGSSYPGLESVQCKPSHLPEQLKTAR